MKRGSCIVLTLLAASLIAVVVAGVALYNGINLEALTPLLERRLTAALEREVSLEGSPRLQIDRTVRIDLPHLRIANATWGSDRPLLQLREAAVSVDLASLLNDAPITINNLTIGELTTSIERGTDGLSNLPTLGSEEDDDDEATPWDKLPVVVEVATLRKGQIILRNEQRQRNVEIALTEVSHNSSTDNGSKLSARGALQGKPWSLQASGTAMQRTALSAPFSMTLNAELAAMRVTGSAKLPELASLEDLALDLQAQGPLPPAITSLSPLLKPETPVEVRLRAIDIEPGIALDADVQLPNLTLQLNGDIHRPLKGDDVDLELRANAPSLRPLTQALGLGETAPSPMKLQAKVRRSGTRISLSDLLLTFGEHQLEGEISFPDFPHTDGAGIRFVASGPDFGFYQRLFERPVGIAAPYTLRATLLEERSGVEMVASALQIGKHQLTINGPLGSFPSYQGSELTFKLAGPSIGVVGDALSLALPDSPYEVYGAVAVDNDGRINLKDIAIDTASIAGNLRGSLNGYPKFDGIDLALAVGTESLASTSTLWGLQPLGEVSASGEAKLRGRPAALDITDIEVDAGGSGLRSEAGAISLREGRLDTDLVVAVNLVNPRELLGAYSNERIPSGPFTMRVSPRLDAELATLLIEDIQGPAAAGSARLQIARTMEIDERTLIEADLHVAEPGRLLPTQANFEPPTSPINIQARTTRTTGGNRLNATINASGEAELNVELLTPLDDSLPTQVKLQGQGRDLHAFGTFGILPAETLPFRLNASASISDLRWAVDSEEVKVGNTLVMGSASYEPGSRSIVATLEIPRAELGKWLTRSDEDDAGEDAKEENSSDNRLIPDRDVPTDWLRRYTSDITLSTGALGLPDPIAPDSELVERMELRLRTGDGSAMLEVSDLIGSRGSLAGKINADANEQSVRTSGELQMSEFLGIALPTAETRDDLPRYEVDAKWSGSGATTREIASTLDGHLLVQGGVGIFRDANLGIATESFVDQLFRTLLPMVQKKSDLKVVCTVLAGTMSDGTFSLDPGFILRSESVDLSANGTIDLETEEISIRFDNQARKGLGVSAAGLVNPYIQITGTLAQPTLGLDMTTGAIAGGAAAATGGLSVVASTLYGRFLKRKDPCKSALSSWEEMQEVP